MYVININAPVGVGVSAADFVDEISRIPKGEDLLVTINTPGGMIPDGMSIYNAIRNFEGKKITRVDGIAASMGSIIAMAGDEIEMSEGTLIMIHNPLTVVGGSADKLRKEAGTLDKFRDSLVGIYSRVTGKSAEELVNIMDAETWYTADEAVEHKFATRKVMGNGVLASMDFKYAAFLNDFTKVPEAAKKFFRDQPAVQQPAVKPTEAEFVARIQAEERVRVQAVSALAFDGFDVQSYIDSGASVADVKAAGFDVAVALLKKKNAEQPAAAPDVAGMLTALQTVASQVKPPEPVPQGDDQGVLAQYARLTGVEKTKFFRENQAAIRAASKLQINKGRKA